VFILFGVIVLALEVGIQGQCGFSCSIGFMGRQCQVRLEVEEYQVLVFLGVVVLGIGGR